jgi:fatty-acyl-CoA synthase
MKLVNRDTHCFQELSPLTFLERSAKVYSSGVAIVHSGGEVSYQELLHRCRCLSSGLKEMGVVNGDRVALILHNGLAAIESHFAVPGAGGIIVSLNPKIDSQAISKQLTFCDAKILIISEEFVHSFGSLFSALIEKGVQIIVVGLAQKGSNEQLIDYETLLAKQVGDTHLDAFIVNEMSSIAINFTSGTTGEPKGVEYSHRAAYLHAIGQVLMMNLTRDSCYFWTLPMFHVNGWGHMWACIATGACQFLLDESELNNIEHTFNRMVNSNATHIAGAPRLVKSIADHAADKNELKGLTILTGGAAPTPSLIEQMLDLEFNLVHQYGLSETCGPLLFCEEGKQWNKLTKEKLVAKKLRQGVPAIHAGNGVRVVDEHLKDIPSDGTSIGEIVIRGNTVAKGYYKNKLATDTAFVDGWFHTGDMAVVHDDGYIEIKDRLKDLIYVETDYGWENISSIEIENTISSHEDVNDVAVVGVKLGEGGECLVAFLELKSAGESIATELDEFCCEKLPDFKVPKYYFNMTLPKTATGKVRKNLLVDEARKRILNEDS